MGCLVKVTGVVTRRSAVFPQLKICKYNCQNCGYVLGPYTVNGGGETKMKGVQCHSCHAKGPYSLNTEQTAYCNYQKVTLQESPGSVPAGRLPRHKEVILTWDLIDIARPGEEIEVTGVCTPLHPTSDAAAGTSAPPVRHLSATRAPPQRHPSTTPRPRWQTRRISTRRSTASRASPSSAP